MEGNQVEGRKEEGIKGEKESYEAGKRRRGKKREGAGRKKIKGLKKFLIKKKIMKSMLCFGPTVLHLMPGILRKSTWQQLFLSDCKVQLFGGLKYQVL